MVEGSFGLRFDPPYQRERESIKAIQIRKYGRNPSEFDLVGLAKRGVGESEIECVFCLALFLAFNNDWEPCVDLT